MNFQLLSRKQLINDCHAVVDSWLQVNTNDTLLSKVNTLRDEISVSLQNSMLLDENKKKLSGEIGRAKKAGEPADGLIKEMQIVSARLKSQKETLAVTADTLLDILQVNEETSDDEVNEPGCPGQFLKIPTPVEKTELHITESLSEEAWNIYVSAHPQATHYHDYAWRKVIQSNFPQKNIYLAAVDSAGDVHGVLSLVHMKNPVFGSFLLSMPWLIYGGMLASTEEAADTLAEYVKRKMVELNCTHAEMRQVHARSDWQSVPGKVAMVLKLPGTVDQLNKNFSASLRSQVKRATDYGPTIIFGGAELLDAFYGVFCEKMRDLGTPVYDRGFFESILNQFRSSTTVVIVSLDGEAVAAAILIKHRVTAEIPWAAARKKHNSKSVNMFLYQKILEHCIDEKYQFFDFGRSTEDSGTFYFKQQWGARPYPLGWHRYPGTNENGVPDDKTAVSLNFQIAIAVWKRLPVWLCNIIGPPVSRHLPW